MASTGSKVPPYPKPKYNDAKFRPIIHLLPLAECMKIEYLSKGTWHKMITRHNYMYNCVCCGVENLGPTPILDHIRGKKHRFALTTAEKLYHPHYTVGKTVNMPTAQEKQPKAGAQQKLNAQQKGAGAGQQQKPQSQKAQQTKDDENQQPEQQKNDEPQADESKSTDQLKDEKSKEEDQSKDGGKLAPQDQQKKSDMEDKNQTAVFGKKLSPKPPRPKRNGIQTLSSAATKTTPVQDENKDKADDKNAANKPQENQKNKNTVEVTEVVILDDDDEPDTVEENTREPQPLPGKSDSQVHQISTIDNAKPQRQQKSSLRPANQQKQVRKDITTNNSPTSQQKGKENTSNDASSKKVLNPAAVLAKSVGNTENKLQYQKDRIIIPLVDKTKRKSTQQPAGSAASGDGKQTQQPGPNFSQKTFTTRVTDDVEGIIGVEYVVKILKIYNDPEPFYECCLCEVVMNGMRMQTHLLGYNHRYKYLEKHFPTCFNQYKEHIGNIQVMGIILDRIAKAIEAHHGRELPYECLSGEFRSNRHGVMTTVYSFRHASEYSGPSFTNVIDAKEIEELYREKAVYHPPKADPKRKPTFDTRANGTAGSGAPPSKRSRVERPPRVDRPGPESENRNSGGNGPRRPYREDGPNNNVMDDAVHKQMVEEFLQNTRGRSRSPGGRRRRHRSRSRSRSPHRLSRRRPNRRSPSPLREGDVWQAYRHLVDRSKNELDDMYREYRREPEKHPLYDEEWRKFWKHRKEQIAREGLDHRNYDFQPEWVRYFAVRIEELYDEAVEDIKISARRRLILPMTNDELEDKRYHIKNVQEDAPEARMQQGNEYRNAPEKKNNVVSVLRLLTALEDYLGSLGPKIVDLLSNALLVEKTNPNEVNEIVLNLENCTILETAMEKLKGVLIAGLLEGPKVRAFNNVISETENILKLAFRIKQRNTQPAPQPVPAPKIQMDFQHPQQRQQQQRQQQQQPQPQQQQPQRPFVGGTAAVGGGGGSFNNPSASNPMASGSGPASNSIGNILSQVDKKELASKLAAALTAQGRTDFNPEQLQQLIAVYSLIDKKKRDSAAASATDKQKMTLSDTLTAFLNPEKPTGGGNNAMSDAPGRVGDNFSNADNDRQPSVNNSSISNFVSMLNRGGGGGGNANSGGAQMWQNLQNIQSSLRMQETSKASSNAMDRNVGGSGFGNNMDNNYNRGGGGGGGYDGGMSGESGNNSGGFNRNFQGMMGNSNFSRGESDDMPNSGGGRSGGLGLGGGSGMSSGNVGGGTSGGFSSNFSSNSGLGGQGGLASRGSAGMGGLNSMAFSRGGNDSFLGMNNSRLGSNTGNSSSVSAFSGNLYSSSNSMGGGGGNLSRLGGLSGNNTGSGSGGNFNRPGPTAGYTNSLNSNFSNQMNRNSGRDDGMSSSFGSNQRNMPGGRNSNIGTGNSAFGNNSMGSNAQAGNTSARGGSNWRNQ